MALPLEGIRVVELCTGAAGPTVAKSLAGWASMGSSVSAGQVARLAKPFARYARRVTGERERNRDRVVRALWVTRRLAREQGRLGTELVPR